MLIKPLRSALSLADFAEQKKSMGLEITKSCLHQVITGPGADEQVREYARELIGRGVLKSPPVEMDCSKPMTDEMVQQLFADAKNGMLFVTNIEQLTRRETFASLAARACGDADCIIALCGEKKAMKILLADDEGLLRRLPQPTDMEDPDILEDSAELKAQTLRAAVAQATVLQAPLKASKRLKVIPKVEN